VTANIRGGGGMFCSRSCTLVSVAKFDNCYHKTGLDLTKIFFFFTSLRSALDSVKLRWAPSEEEVCFKLMQTLFCVCVFS
jgi:hypothetical protein